jgi:hypothetical protein
MTLNAWPTQPLTPLEKFLGQTRIDYPIRFMLRRGTFQTLYIVTGRKHFAAHGTAMRAYSSPKRDVRRGSNRLCTFFVHLRASTRVDRAPNTTRFCSDAAPIAVVPAALGRNP